MVYASYQKGSSTGMAHMSRGAYSVEKRAAVSSAKNRHAQLLPPLHETNFSEQYKQYKGTNQNVVLPPISNQLEMSRDLQDLIRRDIHNRPNMKRSFQRPIFAEESFPLQHGVMAVTDAQAARSGVFKVGGYDAPYTPPYQTFSQNGQEQMQPIFQMGSSGVGMHPGKIIGSSLFVGSEASPGQYQMEPAHQNSTGAASDYMSPLNPTSDTQLPVGAAAM